MSETTPRAKERLPANMTALRRQLVEMAAKAKPAAPTAKEKPAMLQKPVLVVKGK